MSEVKLQPLEGYTKYAVSEGKVTTIADGKEIKPNKKGMIALTRDSDGEVDVLSAADIIAAATPSAPQADEDFKLPTDVQPEAPAASPAPAKEKNDAVEKELKRLRDAVKTATAALIKSKVEDLVSAKDTYDAAVSELEAYKAAHPTAAAKPSSKKADKPVKEDIPVTAEQIAAQEKYDEVKVRFDAVKAELNAAVEELKKFKAVSNGDHSRKMTYRDVQEIRKKLSEGVKPADIMKEYGVSASAVQYYRNYLQHKLRRAPEGTDMTDAENELLYTAWTPLVNEYYPADFKSKDGRTFEGAPYEEDDVKEDASKYKKPASAEAAQA